jgi:hypothetical protein
MKTRTIIIHEKCFDVLTRSGPELDVTHVASFAVDILNAPRLIMECELQTEQNRGKVGYLVRNPRLFALRRVADYIRLDAVLERVHGPVFLQELVVELGHLATPLIGVEEVSQELESAAMREEQNVPRFPGDETEETILAVVLCPRHRPLLSRSWDAACKSSWDE